MRRFLYLLIAGATMAGMFAYATTTPAAQLSLTRLDCGTIHVPDLARFSDTSAYRGKSATLTDSCYLIRHGDDLMIWDTGLPQAGTVAAEGTANPDWTPGRPIGQQLADLRVDPAEVKWLGISHYHNDHTGQADVFANATLLIGKGDWDALTARPPQDNADPVPLARWTERGGRVEAVSGDHDVFGDGSVVMIDAPGHTPGHHALLVRLKSMGPVLLTGDAAHFRENWLTDGVPTFNVSHRETVASIERLKKLAARQHAVVVIQHDPRDVAKLPPFPRAAT